MRKMLEISSCGEKTVPMAQINVSILSWITIGPAAKHRRFAGGPMVARSYMFTGLCTVQADWAVIRLSGSENLSHVFLLNYRD